MLLDMTIVFVWVMLEMENKNAITHQQMVVFMITRQMENVDYLQHMRNLKLLKHITYVVRLLLVGR